MSNPRKINIFGITGSIGQSTVDVILTHKERFDVQVVTAHSNVTKLAELARLLKATHAVIADESKYEALKVELEGSSIKAAAGRKALIEYAEMPADISMMAIVGMVGLEPMLRAMNGSKAIAIANKEPLVAAGPIIMAYAKERGVTLLPVDSEHNAIFQVFDKDNRAAISRLILTASGGPFWDWPKEKIELATREQALAHPNWVMGAKISIDSATMMNKALEVIEAHYLFDMPADKIDVIIHPQSLIHSMVEYNDGSVLSQMGASDMCTPIANVLSYPERLITPGKRLNLNDIQPLTFSKRDDERFPALPMAYESLRSGLYHSITMNAANEVAVEGFLNGKMGFGEIINCIRCTLDSITKQNISTLDDVIMLDEHIRRITRNYIDTSLTNRTVSQI